MTDIFDFIADDEFRDSLKSDFEEVDRAFKSASWKTVLVLCGSIVETIIVDHLLNSESHVLVRSKILSMSFSDLIDTAHRDEMISNNLRDLLSVVKDYRNLIHPGRQVRLNQSPSRENANIAQSLVRMIAEEIGRSARQNRGFTAEQLVSKLERDPTASNIVRHYAHNMSKDQLKKFMVLTAPNRFFELDASIQVCEYEPDLASLLRAQKSISSSYHSAFQLLDDVGKAAVAKRFVQVLNEGSEAYVVGYLENFFRTEFLPLLNSSEREHVEDYVLSCLRSGSPESYLHSIHNLHLHLSGRRHYNYISVIIGRFLRSGPTDIKQTLRGLLLDCLWDSDEERLEQTKRCIADWADHQKNDQIRQDLLTLIKDADEIPF